jgi:hypothetical protein
VSISVMKFICCLATCAVPEDVVVATIFRGLEYDHVLVVFILAKIFICLCLQGFADRCTSIGYSLCS